METIVWNRTEGIVSLSISREKALNALNKQVLEDLNSAINKIDSDASIRCVLITGAGSKAFVAGADIKEMEDMDAGAAKNFSELGQKCFRRLELLNCPVIAVVNGFALGGGLELAMACDFILASDNASFGLPEVSLGLIPGFGGTIRLAKFVGVAKAKEICFSAKYYKADEALKMGLVNCVYPQGELMDRAIEMAQKISKNAPVAVARAKMAIGEGSDLSIDAGMEMERSQFSHLFKTEDKNIGIKAFLNKEKPNFKGE